MFTAKIRRYHRSTPSVRDPDLVDVALTYDGYEIGEATLDLLVSDEGVDIFLCDETDPTMWADSRLCSWLEHMYPSLPIVVAHINHAAMAAYNADMMALRERCHAQTLQAASSYLSR